MNSDSLGPDGLSPTNIPPNDKTVVCCGFTVRALVSRKKLRFVADGVDLDLSYVTDRLIAMGFPSSGLEACYRNPLNEVRKFLEQRHADHYRLWNLCSEKEYSALGFPCEIERFTWDDHTPPPLALVRRPG
jgi:phosphatidylinositol-3,4,5-trisphosphate 3-phosphatase/dual-specificity protein phosphatase PTEN